VGPAGISKADFAASAEEVVLPENAFTLMVKKAVTPGSWVFIATASAVRPNYTKVGGDPANFDTQYELRDGTGALLGSPAYMRGYEDVGLHDASTLTFTGGTYVPDSEAFKSVEVWCRFRGTIGGGGRISTTQLLLMKIGGFGI
jgi:hypothetical protein